MGHQIAALRPSGIDYDGVRIELSYNFPSTPDAAQPFFHNCETISLAMMSKDKDLRPMLISVLREECRVAIKLPDSDFQLSLASSLIHYLSEKRY
jgi:hypothetical protein